MTHLTTVRVQSEFKFTKCLGLAKIVYQFLVWPTKFGPAQNSLEPVERRGISHMPD